MSGRLHFHISEIVLPRAGDPVRIDDKGCWNWEGSHDPRGYGFIYENGKHRAHRVYYALRNGPIDSKWVIHHRCHNPSCVNPDHLEASTPKAHMWHHQVETKRHLTDEQRAELRELALDTEITYDMLAERFDIGKSYAEYIVHGRRFDEHGEGPIKMLPRFCRWCSGEIGPEKRRQAKYCCKEHRFAANSRRQWEKTKAQRAAA